MTHHDQNERSSADINECDEWVGLCDANATCENELGTYRCRCNMGYVGKMIIDRYYLQLLMQ